MKYEEKTVNSSVIFDGRVVKLVVEEVTLPDGSVSEREIVITKNSVGVIAVTRDKKILLVKQYRKALEREIYEIPAGLLEDGEDGLLAAKRELLEETGYGNGEFKLLNEFSVSPGSNRTMFSLYLATDLELVNEKLALDSDEFLDVTAVSHEEFKALYNNGEICDIKTAYALLYLNSIL